MRISSVYVFAVTQLSHHLLQDANVRGALQTLLLAADEKVLAHPLATPDVATAAMILGGSALFLAGHAAFKAVVWQVVPATRLAAIAVLGLLGFLAPHVSAVALGICAGAVLIALAASDRRRRVPVHSSSEATDP